MAAMRKQAEVQGRHLGGRPPYGYRLVDAGPHPNRAHAQWGRRLHRLDPDPSDGSPAFWRSRTSTDWYPAGGDTSVKRGADELSVGLGGAGTVS